MITRQDIKKQITDVFMANPYIQTAYGLSAGSSFEDEFSLVSIENILFEVISYAIFILSAMFDQHRKDVDQAIYEQKSGRLPWYRWMVLQYQAGFDLKPDTLPIQFDNGNATPEQVEQSKIIKYAAVTESDDNKALIIKIAGENNGELEPIDNTFIPGVRRYVDEFKYAGTRVNIINFLPDLLYLDMVIYYNPLVLTAEGVSIRNGNKPVEDALQEFMKELPFNGELVLAHLIDKLQAVEGVEIPHLIVAKTSWIDTTTGGYGYPQIINVKKVPVSGYFKIADFNGISYVVAD